MAASDAYRLPVACATGVRCRTQTIAPGGFDGDASEVRVARFGDAPALLPLTAGVLAGYRTAITHQLPRSLKAGDLAQLRHNRYR